MKQHRQSALAVPSLSTPAWAPESLDGGFGNSWMAEQLGAGSLAVDPAGLIGRATAAFGVELGGTKVVAGEQGAAVAASEGAAATTLGDTVFVGAEVAGLDSATQSWVLMHELAHVAQQQAGGTSADVEADADRMADTAMAGGQSLPTASAAPAQHHHLDLEEVVGAGMAVVDAGVGVVEGAVEAGAELIGGGADLVQQLVSGALTPELLASVTPQQLAGALSQMPPANAAAAVDRVPAGWEMAIGQALFLLAPQLATQVLLLVKPEALARIGQANSELLQRILGVGLDAIMTPGLGVKFAVDASATFGLPVKAGLGSDLEVIHQEGGQFDITISGEALGGADTGVGAGASVGLTGGDGIESGGIGVGASGNAQAGAGLRTTLESEYGIDVLGRSQNVGEVMALWATADSTSLSDAVVRLGLALGFGNFHKSTSVRVEHYAEGKADVDVGVRTGGAKTAPVFGPGEKGVDAGKVATWWQEFTRYFVRLSAKGSSDGTVEFATPKWAEDEDGFQVPEGATLAVEQSKEVLAELAAECPQFGQLPENLAAGKSAGVVFKVLPNGDASFDLADPVWTTGATATYDGTTVKVGTTRNDFFNEGGWRERLGALTDVSLSQETNLDAGLANRFVHAALLAKGLDPSLKGTGNLHGSLTSTWKVSGTALRGALEQCVGDDEVDTKADSVLEAAEAFLTTGTLDALKAIATKAGDAWDMLMRAIVDGHKETALHGELGAGVAAKGTLAGGLKAEAKSTIEGAIVFEESFAEGPDTHEADELLTDSAT